MPAASAPVELINGRARLGKPVAPNANDVTLAGSLDFVEETLDLRFTLVGSGAADAQGLRPELVVLYKGPVSAPRRSIDVSALTSWLTLQSVERESRKLEAEEREAKRRAALDALIREATTATCHRRRSSGFTRHRACVQPPPVGERNTVACDDTEQSRIVERERTRGASAGHWFVCSGVARSAVDPANPRSGGCSALGRR